MLPARNGETITLEEYLLCAARDSAPPEFPADCERAAPNTVPAPHDTVGQEFAWVDDRQAGEDLHVLYSSRDLPSDYARAW